MKKYSGIKHQLDYFLDLFFPVCCAGCDRPLVRGEKWICSFCRYSLPLTDFHKDPQNEGVRLLGGQVPLETVLSYLYFEDDSSVQQMVHHFKYLGLWELGKSFGREYGTLLKMYDHKCLSADLIVPVPIQLAKLRRRGYNQSAIFGEGLAEAMNIPIEPHALIKDPKIKTQVGKGRVERFENLSNAILPNESKPVIEGKYILLVDDVLTSGATIVASANALLQGGATKIGVVTLARKH